MSIISAGTLTSNALRHTADRTGRLVFQTNGTTTALTLDSSQDATFAGGVTVTGNLTVAGTTTSFGDNDKIVLGDGQDLQIYHDGSNSTIADNGTGALILYGSDIIFQKSGSSERLADFAQDGAVRLYYDNSAKLATTSTGIDVTGTAEVDGLSINGTAITATAAELNHVDGVTSSIQTQLDAATSDISAVTLTPQVITTNTTATAGNFYYLNSAGITLTLPASPSTGDQVGIADVVGDTTHVIGRNGSNIMSISEDITWNVAYNSQVLIYTGATLGWAFSG